METLDTIPPEVLCMIVENLNQEELANFRNTHNRFVVYSTSTLFARKSFHENQKWSDLWLSRRTFERLEALSRIKDFVPYISRLQLDVSFIASLRGWTEYQKQSTQQLSLTPTADAELRQFLSDEEAFWKDEGPTTFLSTLFKKLPALKQLTTLTPYGDVDMVSANYTSDDERWCVCSLALEFLYWTLAR